MVGIFAYNEGVNLPRIVSTLVRQLKEYPHLILVFDESDDPESLSMLSRILDEPAHVKVEHAAVRQGRVARANELASRFLQSDFDMMLHFNCDIVLEDGCVTAMIEALEAGYDMVTGVSLSLPGRTLFERALRVMVLPSEVYRLNHFSDSVLPGHMAGYSRPSVRDLYPVPVDGVAEDLLLLVRAERHGLRTLIVPNARAYYRLASSETEYMAASRRVFGMSQNVVKTEGLSALATLRKVYPELSPDALARAIASDPVATVCLPYVFLIRLAARLSADSEVNSLWRVQPSTKQLD